MLVLDAQQTAAALPWEELTSALRDGFIRGCDAPLRHQHTFDIPNESSGTLLLMPAWRSGDYMGLKQVIVIPDNGRRNLSAVSASYQLSSARTGELLAVIDGSVLTNRRTAAASALASTYLSRSESEHLLMVGTGSMAPNLIHSHATVRPIKKVSIWGRNQDRVHQLVKRISAQGLVAHASDDLECSARQAHIISCATLADSPLIFGEWLSPGTHIDLVGAYTPKMRESDDTLMQRSTIFVDTREGALAEAGDLIQPISNNSITKSDIIADLHELCTGQHLGRDHDDEITVFKSVGTALEDLAGAVLAYQGSDKRL